MKVDYKNIVKTSFGIAKREKWLLVFGIALATFTGSMDSNISRQIDSNEITNIGNHLPEGVQTIINSFNYWVSHLTISSLGPLFGGVGLVIIFGIILSWIATSWAQAALIKGAEDALEDKKVEFKKISRVGISYIKKFIIFAILVFLAALVFGIGTAIVAGLIALVSVLTKFYLLTVILGVMAVIAFIYGLLIISLMTNLGRRLIVLKNYTPLNALKIGLKMAREFFWKGVKLSLLNSLISFGIGTIALLVVGIVVGIPGLFLASPIIYALKGNPLSIAPMSAAGLISLGLLFIWSNKVISAFLIVYNTSSWNMFVKQIWKND